MSVTEPGEDDLPDEPDPEAERERAAARAVRDRTERIRLRTPTLVEGPARTGSVVFGGPVGRFATIGRRGWPFVAAMLSAAASVLVALSVLQKGHCVKVGWASPGSLWRECYSDIPIGAQGFSDPWSAGAPGRTQPVLTGVLDWALQRLVPNGASLTEQQMLFALGAVVVVVCIAITVTATAGTLRGTPWLAAHVALSPVLITAAMLSFDAFGIALAAIGLGLWARHRPLAAGVLLGAAVMARSYPLVFVAVLVLLCLRDGRRSDLSRLLAGVVGMCAVCIGLAAAVGGNLFAPYSAWHDATASYGSIWLVLQFTGITIPAHSLSVVVAVCWLLALGVGVLLVRTVPSVSFAPVALVVLVIVLLTGKSMPVQDCLWVLPLLALCAIRWREHLVWAGVEILYFTMVWMYAAQPSNPGKGLPPAGFAVFSVARDLAWIAMAWWAWQAAGSARTALGGDPVHPPYGPRGWRGPLSPVPALPELQNSGNLQNSADSGAEGPAVLQKAAGSQPAN